MNPLDYDAFAISARLATVLDDAGVPYAIGGAIAYGLWGDPRGTHDVDINLFVDHDGLDRALDVLERAGVTLDRDAARRADAEGDVIIGWCEGLRVDSGAGKGSRLPLRKSNLGFTRTEEAFENIDRSSWNQRNGWFRSHPGPFPSFPTLTSL